MSTSLIDSALRRPARSGPDGHDGPDLVAVRAWARSRGYPIDECVGVPPVVLRTYRCLHGGAATDRQVRP